MMRAPAAGRRLAGADGLATTFRVRRRNSARSGVGASPQDAAEAQHPVRHSRRTAYSADRVGGMNSEGSPARRPERSPVRRAVPMARPTLGRAQAQGGFGMGTRF